MICAACRSHNPPEHHFCGNCGARLSAAGSPEREGGERRRVVLMFSDVASSTEIAGQLDPEDWRELLVDYHRAAAAAITGMGGFVAQYLGDGILAYFGWPLAHENDGERAALAGHAVLDAVAELNRTRAERGLVPLGIRIGIHAGEVVVSRPGYVYGEAINVAARVQAIAAVDTVVVTEPVVRTIAGRLATEDLGSRPLRGVDAAVPLYRVLSPRRPQRPPRAVAAAGPFVGRQAELGTLLERWERARGGVGAVVTITGEAGIGKSRLLREFRARIQGAPHTWLELAGSEIFRSTPFHPVSRLLERVLGGADVGQPDARRRRLARALAAGGLEDAESIATVVALLGVGAPAVDLIDATHAAEHRALRLRTLVTLILQSVRRRPGVVVFEDAHWMDPSTLELIEALQAPLAQAPLLMLLTARPEFHARWPQLPHHAHITLGRLGRPETRELVRRTLADDPSADDVVESITDRTSGIPLFAEELARLVTNRTGAGARPEIPDSLAALLNARLDQAGPAREIAQVAAVIGDEISPDLLGVVAGQPAGDLERSLERLVGGGILATHGAPQGQVFVFTHTMLREAAYGSLLRSRRRELHARVADAIVEGRPGTAGDGPEIVARHLAAAERHDRAAESWHQAAVMAIARCAYREAEEACHEALSQVNHVPDTAARQALDLKAQSALASVLQITQGYSAPRTVDAVDRARALAEKVGDLEALMNEVGGRWMILSSAGKFVIASHVAGEFFELARRDGRRGTLGSAYLVRMTSQYRLGDLVGAERSFQEGEPLFAEEGFRRRLGAVAQTFGNASRNAWMLGRPDEARRRIAHALAVAAANDNPYDVAFAEYMAAILAVLMRRAPEARRAAERSMELSDAHGFAQFVPISRIVLGRALVDISPSPEAVTLIRRGIAGMTETGSRVTMTLYLAWLAEAQAAVVSPFEALETIDRALTFNLEERLFRPELLRIRGELWAASGNLDWAEADLQAALAAAAEMGALGLELRAALSLHRLRLRGATGGAPDVVAKVYARFTEGFDTADLMDAAAVTTSPHRP
jgi:class 3 adenylate cyclase/tetratricopeptide (TPR) repeat protein